MGLFVAAVPELGEENRENKAREKKEKKEGWRKENRGGVAEGKKGGDGWESANVQNLLRVLPVVA